MTSLKKMESSNERSDGKYVVLIEVVRQLSYFLVSILSGYGLMQLQKIQDNIIGMMAMSVLVNAYLLLVNIFALFFIISLYNLAKSYTKLLDTKMQAIQRSNLLHKKIEENVSAVSGMVQLLRRG